MKQENLASKSGLTDFIKNTYFDKNLRNVKNKVTSNKICKDWNKTGWPHNFIHKNNNDLVKKVRLISTIHNNK